VAQLVAEQYELPFVDLHVADIELAVARLLDEGLARRFSAVAVGTRSDGCYLVAIADPSTVLFSDELRRTLGGQPTFVVVGQAAIDAAYDHVYREHPEAPDQESSDDVPTEGTVDPEMGILLELPTTDAPAHTDHRWPPLGALLVREGLVSEADLEAALAQQRLSSSMRLGEILVDRGSVTPSDVARLVAEQYELPFVELRELEIDPEAALLLDERIARRRSALPVGRLADGSLRVVLADPTNAFQSDELRSALGASLAFCVAAPEQIEAAIGAMHGAPAPETGHESADVPGGLQHEIEHAYAEQEVAEDGADVHAQDDHEAEEPGIQEIGVEEPAAEHARADHEAEEPVAENPVVEDAPPVDEDAEAGPMEVDDEPELPDAYSVAESASALEREADGLAEGTHLEPEDEVREPHPPEVDSSADDEPAAELDEELLAEVEQTVAVVLEAPAERTLEPAVQPDRTNDLADELDEAIHRALALGATGIQVTPRATGLAVRARIDGSMHDVVTLSPDATPLTARLAERAGVRQPARVPRRGLLVVGHEGRSVPLEVSTLPTTLGLQVGLHVPEATGSHEALSDLGLPHAVESELRAALRKPCGMLLVCGPPLSGRTTTLYAALGELASPERALATVESPVERILPGVDQTEVDTAAGVTFPSALRALLHAGADTVLVGDLRDGETARVAFRGARAERLVLAALEAPTSTSALERLAGELAVENRLASATLTGLVAQHLVRRICVDCRESYYASAEEIAVLGRPDEESGRRLLARGRGCASCAGTGYTGWAAVFEALPLTDDTRALIGDGADPRTLREAAVEAGMATVRDGAIGLCLDGVTTAAEVLQVPRD